MAQVAQGSSVTVQLAKHTGLWVRSTGSAKVTVSAAFAGAVYKQDQFFVGASQQRVGFYDFAADVVIEATTGAAEYEDNPFTYEPLKAEAPGDSADSTALDVALTVNGLQSGKVPFSNIQLAGLPQTPGAPAGYGDLASAISGGVINLTSYNPPSPPSSADSALQAAAADALSQGKILYIPHAALQLNSNSNLGDIVVFANDCTITGSGYPRARQVIGLRKGGLIDGQFAVLPRKSQKSGAKIMYTDANSVWIASPKNIGKGGFLMRLQQSGAPTLSGSGDVGTPWQRWRQTLVHDLTMAWCARITPSAQSGTWTDDAMVASLWKESDGATNLFQTQGLKRNTAAAGEYIEYQVTTDENGIFNVGFRGFSSASDSVEIKDQSNNVVIATLDLRQGASSTAAGYRVFTYNAPKMGTFTLRITNNGSANKDLRVIGVNIQQIFSASDFNSLETYDFFNACRRADPYLNSGSAATPVFSARQGGAGGTAKTGGSIHGGETLNTISWRVNGQQVSAAVPTTGSIYLAESITLRQETTINWPDGQSCNYYEDLEFIGAGAVDCTFSMYSAAGLQLQNAYTGMCPMSPSFNQIVAPQPISLAPPAAEDVIYYPAVSGENAVSMRDPTGGKTIDFYYTVYPDSQVRGYSGGVSVIMRPIGNDDCKIYAPQYLGADKLVYRVAGRSVTVFG